MKKGSEEHALGGRGSRLHRSRAGADPEEGRRSDQDQPTGCCDTRFAPKLRKPNMLNRLLCTSNSQYAIGSRGNRRWRFEGEGLEEM